MTDAPSVLWVKKLDTWVDDTSWEWSEQNRATIDLAWQEIIKKKPKFFNGQILMARNWKTEADCSSATYFKTDFASFLKWFDEGIPDTGIINGFALAALRSKDGAYICGVMGDHTANAGKVYFPGGTPDLSDIREGGFVDFLGSVTRELEEETGLTPSDVEISDDWIVVTQSPYLVYLKPMQLNVDADEAIELLIRNISAQKDPELFGFKAIRSMADVNETVTPYLHTFFKKIFE
ncbi:NUDIX hydrolase [Microvirga sp. W0021]|uniref:NUDIX hydrolase n=1 Tax=Hohaiivirga grylli TaxID=3133970 RepID=A0ABV0BK97_9HYPH